MMKGMLPLWGKSCLSFFLLLASACLGGVPAFAEGALPEPKIRWINREGKILEVSWPFESEWRWEKEHPVHEIRMKVPRQIAIESAEAGAAPVRVDKERSELWLQATTTLTIVRLKFQDSQKQLPVLANLIVELPNRVNHVWNHPSCEKERVQLLPDKSNALFPVYVGLICSREGGALVLTPIWSRELRFHSTSLPGGQVAAGAAHPSVYRVPVPESGRSAVTLGRLEFAQALNRPGSVPKAASFSVQWTSPNASRRFVNGVSLGPSLLKYSEVLTEVEVNEVVLTAKAQSTYWIVPGVWDASVSGYLSVTPLQAQLSPSFILPARFYGINLRSGRNFGAVKLSGGWYFWGMSMKPPLYGLSQVMGPQVLVSARHAFASGRAVSGYLKFAQVGVPQLSIQTNRELAAGAAFDLTGPSAILPLNFTVDVAHARIETSGSDSLALLSMSAAIGVQF